MLLLIFAFLSGVGITYPNTTALSLAPFSKNAGTAAALMGAFQMAIGSFASIVVSLFNARTAVPMAGVMLTAAAVALIILMIGRRMVVEEIEETKEDVNGIVH